MLRMEADAYELIVCYDPDSGFPQKIDIYFVLNVVDEEITYTVSGFSSYD